MQQALRALELVDDLARVLRELLASHEVRALGEGVALSTDARLRERGLGRFEGRSPAASKQAEVEERLRRLRQKENGELEAPNEPQITAAMSMAKQCLDAGLPRNANSASGHSSPRARFAAQTPSSQ